MYVRRIIYGDNTKAHRPTKTSPFSLLLSRTPPESLISARKSISEEFLHLGTKQTKLRIVEKLMRLWLQANSATKTVRALYERLFNRRVRHQLVVLPKGWVYVDKPPVAKRWDAETAAKYPSSLPALKEDGPYQVRRVKTHTMTVDIRGIHNLISINRVTLARTHRGAGLSTESPQDERVDGRADAESRPALDDEDADHPLEYSAKKFVAGRQQDDVTQYRERWYGYKPREGSWDPVEHIPQHFIKRYRDHYRRAAHRGIKKKALLNTQDHRCGQILFRDGCYKQVII